MFVAADAFEDGHVERARTCVFGSGPAGLTLARTLAERGEDVLMIEAGGAEWEYESQELYQGQVVGDPYFLLEDCRLRVFGGTSGHWGGYCRPLDAHDMAGIPGNPASRWPIGVGDLQPYLAEASDILESPGEFPEQQAGPDLVRTMYNYSPPVRFGDKYRDYCETSDRLRVCLNSALVNMVPGDGSADGSGEGAGDASGGTRIRAAEIVTERGPGGAEGRIRWTVEAERFVVCLGGIENSRMLLWINEQNNRALLPDNDIVGRYWMEHPNDSVGEAVLFADRAGLFVERPTHFTLSGSYQQGHDLPNAVFEINEESYTKAKRLAADILCIAPPLGRRLLDGIDKKLVCAARIRSQWEQAPDPENRVVLGDTPDRLGIPQVELHWRNAPSERRTIAASTIALARTFAEQDIGRVKPFDWILDDGLPFPDDDVIASYHHMGGTRMSADPAEGVVDPDLKVHGVENLYVGGSSVFPSAGYANPTLTIVQLALRLADHLRPAA